MIHHLSRSEEDHIKAIHTLTAEGGRATTGAIGERLATKASSVTDMLKRLAGKGLVKHEPYHGVRLTAAGRRFALRLVRKHRLWETFLVDRLGFAWDEVHQVAEQLEHIDSEPLVERLADYLGHPAFDPHGDPIPGPDGELPERDLVPLAACAVGSKLRLAAVADTDDALLGFLRGKAIGIGTRFTLVARHEYDGSVEIKPSHGPVIGLSSRIAAHLQVERP
jgi:DtxR family Mn-dependent transcriptional regulator